MEERLALARVAVPVASHARRFDLRNVPLHRTPPFDLTLVVRAAPSHIVPAIPLEPAAGILGVDPTLFDPHRERLRSVDAEEVQCRVVTFVAQPRSAEPFF